MTNNSGGAGMSRELEGIYALWKRELTIFFRSKSRLLGSLGMPFFFLAILGTGMGSIMSLPQGGSYLQFMAPGVIGMILMFTSVFSGIIVIMDRQFGFLKETLVAPISRLSVVIGKAIGGASTAMVQGTIILVIAVLLGAQINFANILLLFAFMFLISMMFVSIGITIASVMQDMHGFQLVMNFLIMPMFFLSGAFFPLSSAPSLLKAISIINPLSYGVSGLRYLLTGVSDMAFSTSLLVICALVLIFISIAMRTFARIEE